MPTYESGLWWGNLIRLVELRSSREGRAGMALTSRVAVAEKSVRSVRKASLIGSGRQWLVKSER
jgi:hypothetical protein